MPAAESMRPAAPVPPAEPVYAAPVETSHPGAPMRSDAAISVMPPVAPTGPLMDGLSPSAARPLSFLSNGGGAVATAMTPAIPAYSAEDIAPSGPLMDGLPPSAARPLSFLRKNGSAQPPSVAPPQPPAGATPLSRTTEPAPSVRVTNVRKPEPPPGPPEPPAYGDDEDARFYPEEASPEGCASGECIPDDVPSASTAASEPAASAQASGAASPLPASTAQAVAAAPATQASPIAPALHGPASNGHASTAPASHGHASTSPAGASAYAPASTAPAAHGSAAYAPTSPASHGPGVNGHGPHATPAPRVPAAPSVAARPAFTPPAPRAPAGLAPEPDSEPESEPVAPAPVVRGRDNPNLPLIERWRAAVESVKGASIRHGTALANGRLLSMRAGEIILGFLPTAGLHKMAVSAAAGKAIIDKALAEHFGRAVKLSFQDVSPDDSRATLSIAEQDAQSRANHEKSTEGKVRSHPAVRAVLKFLGGEIEHIQVYEPERPSAVPAADTPDDSA